VIFFIERKVLIKKSREEMKEDSGEKHKN